MMRKIILVYEQQGFTENGGGLHIEYPKTLEELDARCNELLTNGRYGDSCKILLAATIDEEYEYQPIERVTKFERQFKEA